MQKLQENMERKDEIEALQQEIEKERKNIRIYENCIRINKSRIIDYSQRIKRIQEIIKEEKKNGKKR